MQSTRQEDLDCPLDSLAARSYDDVTSGKEPGARVADGRLSKEAYYVGMTMPIVNFVNEKKQIEVPVGANLRKEARKHDVQLYPHVRKIVNCHGNGVCGTCRVLITKGIENANDATWAERSHFQLGVCSVLTASMASIAYIGNEDAMRLACRTEVHGDMDVVTTPPLNLFGENFFS